MEFSSINRIDELRKLESNSLDLLIIGGGITGAGIALDAATRGLTTGLVEMQDFAAGTSSRYTKLVHGGLRYLKQFEVKMVADVGKERAIVYENGPHVTTPEWMLLPIHKGGTFGKFSTSIGLRVYDYLAGVKRTERRKMLPGRETLIKEPLLKEDGLLGGGYYVEYRTDDARLTIEVLKEAVNQGATAVNYAKVTGFVYEDGKVTGVDVEDQLTKKTYTIYAKKIVNAAGPWIDSLRELDKSKRNKSLRLTKGIHLVFDQSDFPLNQAIYFDTPDRRMVFAIPRDGKTYVGTTDTVYEADMVHPRMTAADRDYVLNAICHMFPNLSIDKSDVESSWTGLRPLIHEEGRGPSEISRKDEVWESEAGLITIAGGKLTGYRKMAYIIVDLVTKKLQAEGQGTYLPCQTKNLPISGGDVGGSTNFPIFIQKKVKEGIAIGLTEKEANKLVRQYGSNIDKVYQILKELKGEELNNLPLVIAATLEYSIREEMTTKPTDFFIRRTGALFFDIKWVQKWQKSVITYMAEKLNWTKDEVEAYSMELEMHIHDAVVPL